MHSSSSLNLVKSKTAIPPEHILPKRSEGVKINDLSGVFVFKDIFEAIMNRNHASTLRIVDQDERQLERCDFSPSRDKFSSTHTTNQTSCKQYSSKTH